MFLYTQDMLFCPECKFILSLAKVSEAHPNHIGIMVCSHCRFSTPLGDDKIVLFRTFRASKSLVHKEAILTDKLYQCKRITACAGCKGPEAVVWRDNDFNVKYMCTQCGTETSP